MALTSFEMIDMVSVLDCEPSKEAITESAKHLDQDFVSGKKKFGQNFYE